VSLAGADPGSHPRTTPPANAGPPTRGSRTGVIVAVVAGTVIIAVVIVVGLVRRRATA